jgi:gamma-butyrobetaine dioxygenase
MASAPARIADSYLPITMRATAIARWARLGAGALELDGGHTPLPFRWLRDACPCARCVHPSTRQKLFETSALAADAVAPRASRVVGESVEVAWGDGHASAYPREYLERYASAGARARFHHDGDARPVRWDAARIRTTPALHVSYASLASAPGRLAAYTQLARYGLLFVAGVPTQETSDEKCELRALAGVFGELRSTFYGPTWDVRSVRDSANIAYTDLNLGLHMDLLYFAHPPRYQILHCLRNRVRGGTSLFVDAFAAAGALSTTDFATLARTPMPFHYVHPTHHLHRSHPTLQLSYGARAEDGADALAHVNYSPPFQAPLAPDTPPAFYTALGAFAAELARPERVLRHRLREGEAVLFDNRRVLHARTAFGAAATAPEPEDEGLEVQEVRDGESDRWLKGCYLEADDVEDRRRVLLDEMTWWET